jgi:hypothetical protein
MLHNRIKILQLLYYATLFCNLNLNYLCYIYYFFKTLIKYNGLQTQLNILVLGISESGNDSVVNPQSLENVGY